MNKLYRPSVYTIPVVIKDEPGKTLLIHGYTGAMDIASEKIMNCLQPEKRYSYDNIPLSKDVFDRLIARGYFTDKSEQEEYEYLKNFISLFNRYEKTKSKVFTLMIAYDCNFRCPYCYEGNISGKGRQWSKKIFNKDMVDRAYQAMEEIEPNKNLRAKTITLYGGEPLMASNREIIEYIVIKGKSLGYNFDAVTNGYDLEYFLDLLGPESIKFLQITIDGEKEYHDKRRIHYKDGKSFDKIIANISKALKTGVSISVRANTDGRNISSMRNLKNYFYELGFYNYKTFSFYSALLCGEKSDVDKVKKNTQTSELNKKFEYLSREEFLLKQEQNDSDIWGQDYGVFTKIYRALKNSSKIQFHTIFCPSQTNSYILDPYGEIYSCWDTVGKRERCLGSYLDDIVWNEKERSLWHNRNIGTVADCAHCKYALFCGGGCMGKVLANGGSFESNFCDSYSLIFEKYVIQAYKKYRAEMH